jgi:hypothetical protein
MTMPLIPGLSGQASAPSLADMIAALPDEELAALEQGAQEALSQGRLDDLLGTQSPDASTGLDAAGDDEEPSSVGEPSGVPGEGGAEEQETAADEAAESPEQQAAEDEAGTEEQDPGEFVDQAKEAAKQSEDAVKELAKLVEDSEEHEDAGIDVSALEDLLAQAQKADEDAQEAAEAADTAKDEEDIQAAAQAAKDAQDALGRVAQALAQAKQQVGSDHQAAMDEHKVPDHVAAMDAWAKQVTGGG